MHKKNTVIDDEAFTGSIVQNSGVMDGKPVIAGTDVTVEHLLEMLAEGKSLDTILTLNPSLTRETIDAALHFVMKRIQEDHL